MLLDDQARAAQQEGHAHTHTAHVWQIHRVVGMRVLEQYIYIYTVAGYFYVYQYI